MSAVHACCVSHGLHALAIEVGHLFADVELQMFTSFASCEAVVETPKFSLNILPQPSDSLSVHALSPSGDHAQRSYPTFTSRFLSLTRVVVLAAGVAGTLAVCHVSAPEAGVSSSPKPSTLDKWLTAKLHERSAYRTKDRLNASTTEPRRGAFTNTRRCDSDLNPPFPIPHTLVGARLEAGQFPLPRLAILCPRR